MKIVKNSWSYALYILLWFPVTTLFQDLVSPINKLLFAIVVFFMAVSVFDGEMLKNRKDLLIVVAAALVYLKALTYGLPENKNMLFYFPFFVLLTWFVLARYEKISSLMVERINYVLLVSLAWTVSVVISIFLPSSYYKPETWQVVYFYSYTSSSFRLAPSALFIMVLVLWITIIKGQKRYLLLDIVPLYCMFMGASRTYTVLGIIVFIINWYFGFKNKKWFYISCLPVACLLVYVLSLSAGMYKLSGSISTAETLSGLLNRLTSGRNVFWSDMLNAYWNGDILTKLFGGGLNFTVDVSGIWAHNDFIEILCAHGVIGVLVYVYFMYRLLHVFLLPEGFKKRKMPVFLLGAIILVWLFNACFNMYYTYFCAMVSYPIMLIGIRRHYYGDGRGLNIEADENCNQHNLDEECKQVYNQNNEKIVPVQPEGGGIPLIAN